MKTQQKLLPLMNKLICQLKNKSFEYNNVKYTGSAIPSACLFQLKNDVIDELVDPYFDVKKLVLEKSVGLGPIMTVRQYRIFYGDDNLKIDNLNLNFYVRVNQNNPASLLSAKDFRAICKYIKINYKDQL